MVPGGKTLSRSEAAIKSLPFSFGLSDEKSFPSFCFLNK
jgi:hypothetical protein